MTLMLGQGYLHGDFMTVAESHHAGWCHACSGHAQHGHFHAWYSVPDSRSVHWSGFPGRIVLSGQGKADGSNSY